MTVLLTLILLTAVIIFWAILIYNKLITRRQMTEEGWSGIDVQLKRRASLIPNVIEAVKGYMAHEKGTLEAVTSMRAKCEQAANQGIEERGEAEGKLSGALMHLFAVAEQYPELKASQNFLELQQNLAELEDQIQLARRYYNGAVRDLNILVESFPSNLIAKQFHFEKSTYFELTEASERAVPKVNFKQS